MILELRASSKFWTKLDKNRRIIEPKDRYLQFETFDELREFLKKVEYGKLRSVKLAISTILNDSEFKITKDELFRELDLFGKDTESYMDKLMKE